MRTKRFKSRKLQKRGTYKKGGVKRKGILQRNIKRAKLSFAKRNKSKRLIGGYEEEEDYWEEKSNDPRCVTYEKDPFTDEEDEVPMTLSQCEEYLNNRYYD
jgi:hypothetical protein